MDDIVVVKYDKLMEDIRAVIRYEMSQAKPVTATQQPSSDDLLTIKDAAAMLGVCVATVHEWKRRGMLVFQKLGGRAYIRHSEVLSAGIQHQRTAKPARSKGG